MSEQYIFVRRLEAASGRMAAVSANDGVSVVRRARDGLVCVEKRLSDAEGGAYPREIHIHRMLLHPNLVQYVDSVIPPSLSVSAAAGDAEFKVYVEYCSLGSLEDMLKRLRLADRRSSRSVRLPEPFIWHAFLSLARALVYLRTGSSHPTQVRHAPAWTPLLHRDIKPANIFLRPSSSSSPSSTSKLSKSTSSTSPISPFTTTTTAATDRSSTARGYPDVVLGDLGSAISSRDPALASHQPFFVGTPMWQPPELPRHDELGRGDVWAAGAVVQALCRLDTGPVDVGMRPRGTDAKDWMQSAAARRPDTADPAYSDALNAALAAALALDVAQRPTAAALLPRLLQLHAQAGVPAYEPLPDAALPAPTAAASSSYASSAAKGASGRGRQQPVTRRPGRGRFS
jgi:serine/threonine protein kinase